MTKQRKSVRMSHGARDLGIILILVWAISGIAATAMEFNSMKSCFGTPCWKDPASYLVLLMSAIAGPILWIGFRSYHRSLIKSVR